MNKYIDADALKKEIKHHIELMENEPTSYAKARIDEANETLSVIDALTEPKVDLVAELKKYLATTPKEQLEKDWKELEPYGNIGPSVREFLYGKSPKVDLEKEIEKQIRSIFYDLDGIAIIGTSKYASVEDMEYIARHFYELGLNARKEE